MSLSIGQKAPDFTLKNSGGEDVSLSDFSGKKNVVILFFPLAFSSVCTDELCQVRDDYQKFDSLDAQVLGISVDSFFTLKEFKESQEYNFPLLSDFNKTTATAYGAIYDEFFGMKGVAKRSAFVIDKEGTVKYAEVLEKASDLPNFEEIKSVLSGL